MSALSSSVVETGLGDLGAALGYLGYRLGPTVPGHISDPSGWLLEGKFKLIHLLGEC